MCCSQEELKNEFTKVSEEFQKISTGMSTAKSVSKRAYYYAMLYKLNKSISAEMETLKKELIMENCIELFPEDDLKVFIKSGGASSEVDKFALFEELKKQKRIMDYVSISTVSQKLVKTLSDGDLLVAKFKVETGERASSLIVSALTEDDRKKI